MSKSQLSIMAALLFTAAAVASAQQPTPPAPVPAPAPAPAPAPVAAPAAAPVAAPAAAAAPTGVAASMPPETVKPVAASPTVLQQQLAAFLLRGITLTPDQKIKLEQLMAQHREDRLAFGAPTADSAALAARIKIVRRHMAENRSVLTPEQQVIYDKNLATMKALLEP